MLPPGTPLESDVAAVDDLALRFLPGSGALAGIRLAVPLESSGSRAVETLAVDMRADRLKDMLAVRAVDASKLGHNYVQSVSE